MRAQIPMWFAASLQYLAIVTRKTLSTSAARLVSRACPSCRACARPDILGSSG